MSSSSSQEPGSSSNFTAGIAILSSPTGSTPPLPPELGRSSSLPRVSKHRSHHHHHHHHHHGQHGNREHHHKDREHSGQAQHHQQQQHHGRKPRLPSQTSESLMSVGEDSVKSVEQRRRATPEEVTEENKRVTFIVGMATGLIFLSAFILIAVTLKMTPKIDEILRKENEHLLKSIQQTATSYNATTSTTTGSTTLQSEDTLNNNSNNNNNSFNIVNSKSLPRTTDNLNNNQGADEDYNSNNDEVRKENKMNLDGTADNADQ